LYLPVGLWVGLVAGVCVLGKPFPGFKVLLVDGNLVGFVGLFVFDDIGFTFEAKNVTPENIQTITIGVLDHVLTVNLVRS